MTAPADDPDRLGFPCCQTGNSMTAPVETSTADHRPRCRRDFQPCVCFLQSLDHQSLAEVICRLPKMGVPHNDPKLDRFCSFCIVAHGKMGSPIFRHAPGPKWLQFLLSVSPIAGSSVICYIYHFFSVVQWIDHQLIQMFLWLESVAAPSF